jgi:hypothetical protein
MNKREKLVRKLKDALDEDKTLQGDLGIQEVEEVLLFLLEESAPGDSVMSDDAKISAGSRDDEGHPEHDAHFEKPEKAPAVNKEHVQPKPGNPERHLGNVVDESDNADKSLGTSDDDSESVRSKKVSRPTEDVFDLPLGPRTESEVKRGKK